MPKFVEENQFSSPSPSPSPSTQTLSGWENIVHQRDQSRGTTKANECGEQEPMRPKAHRQPSEREASQKSSIYRGVTKYTETRFEAFVWDNSRSGRGKAVYIGAYKNEIEAARAHDLVAIKIWGLSTSTNFPVSWYLEEISEMESRSKKEWIYYVRRAGKDKTQSDYLGVSRNSKSKKWQARLDKGNGMPDLYLGTFDTEEDAAKAYDIASIRWMGKEAVTNFGLCSYDNVDISKSATLPTEEAIVSSSLETQIVDGVLSQRRDNEACHPYTKSNEHKSSSSYDQNINHHYQNLHQDVITSSSFTSHHQNNVLNQSNPYVLDGLTSTGAEVGDVTSDYDAMFQNQGSTIEQSMFLGTSQESQAPPQALLNQSENIVNDQSHENLFDNQFLHQSPSILLQDYHDYSFQNDLIFQNDLTFLDWSYDFEKLDSALNGESSVHNMVNRTEFHPMEPCNQEFQPQNQLPLLQNMDQNLSSCLLNDFQNPCSEINSGIQGEMAESQTDLDISQYLNSSYMEETDHWTDLINELSAPTEADINSTSNLGFNEDGTQP